MQTKPLADWDEILLFHSLSKVNLNSSERIRLCFSKADRILEKLQEGENLAAVLCHGQSDGRFKRLKGLNAALGLDEGIEIVESTLKFQDILEKTLIRPAAYPMMLLICCTLILIFFMNSILPAMASYAGGQEKGQLTVILLLFLILLMLIAAGLMFFVLGLRSRKWALKILALPLVGNMIRTVFALQLGSLFERLYRLDLSTNDLLKTLEGLKGYPLCAQSAGLWLLHLEKGGSFEQCIRFDPLFDEGSRMLFLCGMLQGNLNQSLQALLTLSENRLKLKARRLCLWLSIFSYAGVGLVMICAYGILFSPLNAITL